MERGPVLAIDLGTRRIGLAISDPDATIAFPVGALERKGRKADLEALQDLIAERGVTRLVVGLPLHLDGRAGGAAEAARRFADALRAATGLPVALVDERWTTREAERAVQASGRSRGRRQRARTRGEVDAMAASLLLRSYLEAP